MTDRMWNSTQENYPLPSTLTFEDYMNMHIAEPLLHSSNPQLDNNRTNTDAAVDPRTPAPNNLPQSTRAHETGDTVNPTASTPRNQENDNDRNDRRPKRNEIKSTQTKTTDTTPENKTPAQQTQTTNPAAKNREKRTNKNRHSIHIKRHCNLQDTCRILINKTKQKRHTQTDKTNYTYVKK